MKIKISPIIDPTQISSIGGRPHSKYEQLIARAKQVPPARTVVVHPCDETSLRGAAEAAEIGIIKPILVGPAAKITAAARQHKIEIGGFTLVDAAQSDAAANRGVELIREGQGELLMKGSLHTDELMRAVTSGSTGLRTARRISHVFVMDVPTYTEVLLITDAAINIFPDLEAKRDIIQNAIDFFNAARTRNAAGCDPFGGRDGDHQVFPRRSTRLLSARWPIADRSPAGILDGPLAFDNAVDPEAARI